LEWQLYEAPLQFIAVNLEFIMKSLNDACNSYSNHIFYHTIINNH
jgi:hypothetical protein